MNAKTKRRMMAVTGVIVIVLVIVLAVVGGSSSAKTVSIAEAATGDFSDKKIQVTGNVVENSFSLDDNVLTFSIYDPETDATAQTQLRVSYDGGVSATFGNDVVAICTGKIDDQGVLRCSELVTKCPSKYENASEALDIARLLEYGEGVYDKPVKVAGIVKAGTLVSVGKGDRMVLVSESDGTELPIVFDGALSDEVKEGSSLVITGSLGANGKFTATDVALEG